MLKNGKYKSGIWLGVLVILLCFSKLHNSIDLNGYLDVSADGIEHNFHRIPYPDASSVGFGAYFQSPLIALLFVPMSFLPRFWAKLLWGIGNLFLIAYLYRRFSGPREYAKILFLLFIFTHGLSDVFLSGNLAFTVLGLSVLGWDWTLKKGARYPFGVAILSALPFFRPQAVILFLWFWWIGKRKQAIQCFIGLISWFIFTLCLLPEGLRWWKLWWQALPWYPRAIGMGHEAFQSPMALLYRMITLFGGMDINVAERYIMGFSTLSFITLAFYSAQKYRKGLPEIWAFSILISGHFLLNPFSWASTALFLVPLTLLAIQKGIPRVAWAGAIFYAILPKALWPFSIWMYIAKYGIQSIGFIMVTIGLFQQVKKANPDS